MDELELDFDEDPTWAISGYIQYEFGYRTWAECYHNYPMLAIVTAGMLSLGFKHVLVGLMMFGIERVIKTNTPLVCDVRGVSGVWSAFAGYLIGSWYLGKGWAYLVMGGIPALTHLPGGPTPVNLFAHGLPLLLGFLIAIARFPKLLNL